MVANLKEETARNPRPAKIPGGRALEGDQPCGSVVPGRIGSLREVPPAAIYQITTVAEPSAEVSGWKKEEGTRTVRCIPVPPGRKGDGQALKGRGYEFSGRQKQAEKHSGDDPLSHGATPQYHRRIRGLTSVFGMGTGVTLPP